MVSIRLRRLRIAPQAFRPEGASLQRRSCTAGEIPRSRGGLAAAGAITANPPHSVIPNTSCTLRPVFCSNLSINELGDDEPPVIARRAFEKVCILERNVEQRGEYSGYAAQDGGTVAMADPPEILDHAGISEACRRKQQDAPSRHEERQPENDRACHVEQRQSMGENIRARVLKHRRPPKRCDDLVPMRVRRKLRSTGGAARMEIGGDIVACSRTVEIQSAAGISIDRRREMKSTAPHHAFVRRDLHQLHFRQQPDDGQCLLPDFGLRRGAERHQDLDLSGAKKVCDMSGLQQKIDRQGISGGLRSPQNKMRLPEDAEA